MSVVDREKIVQLNNSIAQHANRKELDEAMALYKQAVADGSANSHTYAAAINANIRCGRLDGAEGVMHAMQKKGRKRDVIICTTMIKGYCMAGKLTDALNLLKDMTEKKPIVSPNIRTINTLLRGCVQAGDVASAETLVAQSQKDFKIQLDVSSWEYLTALLAQGLKLDKVLPIVGRLKDDPLYASGIANMHVNMARAAAVLGEWKTCKKSLTAALVAIDAKSDATDPAAESSTTQAVVQGKNTGGKRAWKAAEDVDARRAESLELYQQHSKEELKAEIKNIEEFMDRMKAASTDSFQYFFPYYFRFFPFPEQIEDKGDGAVSKKDLVKPLMRAIESSFGLDVFSRRLAGKSCDELSGYSLSNAPEVAAAPKTLTKQQKKKLKEKQEAAAKLAPEGTEAAVEAPVPVVVAPVVKEKPVLTPIQQQITSFRAHTAKAFDSSGKFAFSKVFSAGAAPTSAPVKRALKVEVCSGAGEWAVSQAKQDKESDWVTLELRHDRAYQTLTKAVFADVHNMCVISGDAMKILPAHFPSNAAANIYVNHPEPPQQTGGTGDSQGRHLLEEAFFVEACRILEPEGIFTIVTDNAWYGRLLMRLVSNIAFAAYADPAGGADYCLQTVVPNAAKRVGAHVCEWQVQDSEGDVTLYVGKPGAAAGHVTDASSYFDRLWKRSSLVERYFLVLRKVRTSTVAATAGHGASKKRPVAAMSSSTLNIGGVEGKEGKNTRIKFD